MQRQALTAGVGASVLVAVTFCALAIGCGLGPSEAFAAFAVAGTLTLFLAAI
jgi:hypothetical protein